MKLFKLHVICVICIAQTNKISAFEILKVLF